VKKKGFVMSMSNQNLKTLIYSDLYRYYGKADILTLLYALALGIEYKYLFWMRLRRYASERSFAWFGINIISWLFIRKYMFKFGIAIPPNAEIGLGLYVGHFGGIIVSSKARIGKNCNISQGVTIGQSYRGSRAGAPVLGDNVFVGPGAKIFGNLRIGNNVAIGANCVVTNDVEDNAVVAGVPGKVISHKGSDGYISNKWEN
jgi:serine O-acetyltransferase